jgi:hypothetical protein
MKLGEVLEDLVTDDTFVKDDYDVLIEDDSAGNGPQGNYFEIEEVRWQHNEKRVYIKMGALTNEQEDNDDMEDDHVRRPKG